MTHLSVSPKAAIALAATGLLSGMIVSGLVMIDALDDEETAIENAYRARVERLTTDKIKQSLTKAYAEGLRNIIRNFLERDLKEEIDNLKLSVESKRNKIKQFQQDESNLISLRMEVSKIRNRLKELDNMELKMD